MNINEPDNRLGFALPFHNQHNPTLKDRDAAGKPPRSKFLSWMNDDVCTSKADSSPSHQNTNSCRFEIILLPCQENLQALLYSSSLHSQEPKSHFSPTFQSRGMKSVLPPTQVSWCTLPYVSVSLSPWTHGYFSELVEVSLIRLWVSSSPAVVQMLIFRWLSVCASLERCHISGGLCWRFPRC